MESHPFIIEEFSTKKRRPKDQNKDNFNPRWPNLFNVVIESLEMKEIDLKGAPLYLVK